MILAHIKILRPDLTSQEAEERYARLSRQFMYHANETELGGEFIDSCILNERHQTLLIVRQGKPWWRREKEEQCRWPVLSLEQWQQKRWLILVAIKEGFYHYLRREIDLVEDEINGDAPEHVSWMAQALQLVVGSNNKWTANFCAVDIKIVELLLEHGANPNEIVANQPILPLFLSSASDDYVKRRPIRVLDIIVLFSKYGVDLSTEVREVYDDLSRYCASTDMNSLRKFACYDRATCTGMPRHVEWKGIQELPAKAVTNRRVQEPASHITRPWKHRPTCLLIFMLAILIPLVAMFRGPYDIE